MLAWLERQSHTGRSSLTSFGCLHTLVGGATHLCPLLVACGGASGLWRERTRLRWSSSRRRSRRWRRGLGRRPAGWSWSDCSRSKKYLQTGPGFGEVLRGVRGLSEVMASLGNVFGAFGEVLRTPREFRDLSEPWTPLNGPLGPRIGTGRAAGTIKRDARLTCEELLGESAMSR